MSDELAFLDATAQAELIRSGKLSPREAVDAAIARIERLNPELNAVIIPLFEKARAAAAGTLPDGPFRGVPMLMKDFLGYTAGDPTYMGTRPLKQLGFIAPSDTHLATKLRNAGFVLLGRTNTPELGVLPTTEPDSFGPTRNPWNTSHSTGGSSGGSAAAVASGMVAVGHANDGGGSIRIPASECGLVGLKPTRGRTSFGPDVGEPLFGLVTEGVVSRSVRDTAAVLDAIAGAMPGDPSSAPPPARPFLKEIGADPGTLRTGVLTRAPGEQFVVHPECVAAAENAGRLLESLGHRVEAGHPAALDEAEVGQHFSTMYATNAARLVEVLSLFCGRELGAEDFDVFNWTLAGLGRVVTATQHIATIEWLHGFTRRMAGWWEGGFDLLLTPTLTIPPPPLGYFDATKEDPFFVGAKASQLAAYTLPFNMTGRPAVSLPLHWTADGLPVGVQLVADYAREDLLLRVAAQLEQAAPWASRRPPLHA